MQWQRKDLKIIEIFVAIEHITKKKDFVSDLKLVKILKLGSSVLT